MHFSFWVLLLKQSSCVTFSVVIALLLDSQAIHQVILFSCNNPSSDGGHFDKRHVDLQLLDTAVITEHLLSAPLHVRLYSACFTDISYHSATCLHCRLGDSHERVYMTDITQPCTAMMRFEAL